MEVETSPDSANVMATLAARLSRIGRKVAGKGSVGFSSLRTDAWAEAVNAVKLFQLSPAEVLA